MTPPSQNSPVPIYVSVIYKAMNTDMNMDMETDTDTDRHGHSMDMDLDMDMRLLSNRKNETCKSSPLHLVKSCFLFPIRWHFVRDG